MTTTIKHDVNKSEEGLVMDIVVGRTSYVNRDASKKNDPRYLAKKKKNEERRKNKRDRRKSVRDGVIVTLSYKNDRRVGKDRRKNNS